MKSFRADLHIHTVLSPCGDLDMSPGNIVSEAAKKGLDIIGITDHNTTRHCALVTSLASEKGIFVMQGAEITTKEEVHCLAFFENTDTLNLFQEYLDEYLPDILNDPAVFGHQVQVDENEKIIYTEKKLLIMSIAQSMEEVERYVHMLNGLFIPAHIDRMKNSIYSQLGFMPENIKADAMELTGLSSNSKFIEDHPEIKKFPVLRNSDAHYTESIGERTTNMQLEKPTFSEIRLALKGLDGRKTETE